MKTWPKLHVTGQFSVCLMTAKILDLSKLKAIAGDKFKGNPNGKICSG